MTQLKKWWRCNTKAYRAGVKVGEKLGKAHAKNKIAEPDYDETDADIQQQGK